MITIHTFIGSPFGRAAIIGCHEKQLPYRIEALIPGKHRTAEHLARHPFGKVPVIDDDGFVLYETPAILRYFDQIGPGPSLTPADARAAARMNQAMDVVECYLFSQSGVVPLVFNRVVAPALGLPSDEAAVEACLPQARHCLGVMAGFLANDPYMAGPALSLADLLAGPHLDMIADTPEGAQMIAGTPIVAWLERLRARPSFAATTWSELAKAA